MRTEDGRMYRRNRRHLRKTREPPANERSELSLPINPHQTHASAEVPANHTSSPDPAFEVPAMLPAPYAGRKPARTNEYGKGSNHHQKWKSYQIYKEQ